MIQNATRHTLNGAKDNLSKMEETFQDDEEFSFNLNSFVQAARNITWHMQKQYGEKEGFGNKIDDKWDGWYGSKEDEMNIPYLRFLLKARNYSVKEGPLPTGATRTTNLDMSMILAGEGSKPDVPVNETEPLPASEPPKSKTISRWFWDVASYLDKGDKVHVPDFEKTDVIETCEKILEYLDKLVYECEKKFS